MLVEEMVKKVSHRQACKFGLNRSSYFYELKRKDDGEVIHELTLLTQKHVSIGFWQCYHRLRRKGFKWNHKKVYRIYTNEAQYPPKGQKDCPQGSRTLIGSRWDQPGLVIDFMSDSLWDGRKFGY